MERKVEISSAPFLFGQEQAFQVIGSINESRPSDKKIALELYPGIHWPSVVTKEKIALWRQRHGEVPITRVHLPFSYDLQSAWRSYRRTRMVPSERILIGPLLLYLMGTVSNMVALEIAKAEGAEVNMHVSVAEQANKLGALVKIRESACGVYVENEGSFSSSDPIQIRKDRSPVRSLRAVKANKLDGVIYGADHSFNYGIDPVEELLEFPNEYKQMIRSIHIAGARHHGLLSGNDPNVRRLLEYTDQNLPPKTSFCVDMSPFVIRRKPFLLTKKSIAKQRNMVLDVLNIFES